jgi:hypothetical protein
MAFLGRNNEVTEVLERHVLARADIGTLDDETPMHHDTQLLEASVMIGHRKAAELLLSRLAGSGSRTTGHMYPTCVGRHLGAAAAFLNRPEEARTYYAEALKVATEMQFGPEIALIRLQLAELLLEHYPDEKSEALEHLDFSIEEFRDMKMQPYLERALRHKDILTA